MKPRIPTLREFQKWKPRRIIRKERITAIAATVAKYTPDVAVNLGILMGWALITTAVSLVLLKWNRVVWLASTGLLVWGYVGYGYIWTVFRRGLYDLAQSDDKDS